MNQIKLTDRYDGKPCKVIFKGRDLSQEKENEIIAKYPDYEVKEIGYMGDLGYVYELAIFEKKL